jgi:hypothetical protein
MDQSEGAAARLDRGARLEKVHGVKFRNIKDEQTERLSERRGEQKGRY